MNFDLFTKEVIPLRRRVSSSCKRRLGKDGQSLQKDRVLQRIRSTTRRRYYNVAILPQDDRLQRILTEIFLKGQGRFSHLECIRFCIYDGIAS